MEKILVLGAGLVGKTIALDLSKEYKVACSDINRESLVVLQSKNSDIKTFREDLSDSKKLTKIVKNYDLIVGALPGFMGFEAVKNVIKAGKDIVDISFFSEDPFLLDEIAKENNVAAVVDCGVAPGMGNILLGHYNQNMEVTDYSCMVGGLPVVREWPYEYKAPFSPVDVIEEYTRPARIVQNGKIITREALSDPELIEFDGIGTLEAWNTDGLRTLLKTMKIPNMIEKTLRYPNTGLYLKALRESGFFSTDAIEVNGNLIKPLELTSKILFKKWKLEEEDREFTVMKIDIHGVQNNKKRKITCLLTDHYDVKTGTTSMARTTGFTCTAVVNLILKKGFNRKGIIAPEFLGEKEENLGYILNYLDQRGVSYKIEHHDL